MWRKIIVEMIWSYDWRLFWRTEDDEKLYYRLDDSLIIEYFALPDYWPAYFHTTSWWYKNLTKIDESDYIIARLKRLD